MVAASFNLTLLAKKQETSDVFSFYFKKPDNFSFNPGQYLKVSLDIDDVDERGNSRFFTIASSPTEKDIVITTRIIKSSFKKKLSEIQVGESINVRGPHGNFVFNENEKRPQVFLTGGIGITPFRSMFIFARDNKLSNKIYLFASFKSKEDLMFYDELNQAVNHDRYFIPTITSESNNWDGEKGRINVEMINRHLANAKNSVYYIAGPANMVSSLKQILELQNIAEDQIKTEDFPGY